MVPDASPRFKKPVGVRLSFLSVTLNIYIYIHTHTLALPRTREKSLALGTYLGATAADRVQALYFSALSLQCHGELSVSGGKPFTRQEWNSVYFRQLELFVTPMNSRVTTA